MNLLDIPLELIANIASYLNVYEMCNLRLVSSRFSSVVYNEIKKTNDYYLYLHNIYLTEHIAGILNKNDEEILKYYNWKEVEKNSFCQKNFLINFFGPTIPWEYSINGMKKVTCSCSKKYCSGVIYFINTYGTIKDIEKYWIKEKNFSDIIMGPVGIKKGLLMAIEKLKI